MNSLYVICGLGIAALIAEILNMRKRLTAFLIIGLAAAAILVVFDWGTNAAYFSNMVVFDKFSLAFIALISVVSVAWLWMCGEYFKDQHQTDKSALVLERNSTAPFHVQRYFISSPVRQYLCFVCTFFRNECL